MLSGETSDYLVERDATEGPKRHTSQRKHSRRLGRRAGPSGRSPHTGRVASDSVGCFAPSHPQGAGRAQQAQTLAPSLHDRTEHEQY